jgi:hypothetical protein
MTAIMSKIWYIPTVGDWYCPDQSHIESSVIVTGYDDNFVYLKRANLLYANSPEQNFKLKWDAWKTSQWQKVGIGKQLAFV